MNKKAVERLLQVTDKVYPSFEIEFVSNLNAENSAFFYCKSKCCVI